MRPMKHLDLDALRGAIAAAPPEGLVELPTTKRWLEQVELEISAGRAAQAQLAVRQGMDVVIDTITSGARA